MSKHLAPLIAVYAVVATLVLVGDPRAAEQPPPNPPGSGEAGQPDVEAAQPTTTPNAQQAPAPAQDAAPAQETTPTPSPPVAVAAGPGSVSIVDFDFSPGTITVDAGDTVTWTNTGKEGHSATGSGFDTGILSKGQSGSHTFGSAGSFSYHCTPHPFMKGTVVVRAASSGGGGGSNGGGSGGGSSGGGAGSANGSQGSDSSTTGSTASGSPGLPATGADAAALGGLGLLLLGLGLAIRRRAATGP